MKSNSNVSLCKTQRLESISYSYPPIGSECHGHTFVKHSAFPMVSQSKDHIQMTPFNRKFCLLWPGTWHGDTKFCCGNAQSHVNSISCVQSHVYFIACREVWLSVFKGISKDKHLLWASWMLTKYKVYSSN